MKEWLLDALAHIDVSELETIEWLKVGIALKAEGFSVDVWDDWSATDIERYSPGECQRRWKYFKGTEATGASIVYLAQKNGWHPQGLNHECEGADEFVIPPKPEPEDSYLDDLLKCEGIPHYDLIHYLKAIYQPDELLPVITTAEQDSKGKWGPRKAKFWKCSELINKLRETGSVENTIGGYNYEAGVWIGCNAFDGIGQKQENVISFRYTLIECDHDSDGNEIPFREQLKMLWDSDLPIAAMIHSGGKSLHAVVHVDAQDIVQYKARVKFIHNNLIAIGIPIDTQTASANKTPRMPGVVRKGNPQYLVITNIGTSSYVEWVSKIAVI